MQTEIWIDEKTHYKAAGQVSGGRMTGATVDDNNGITIDRNATFESKDDEMKSDPFADESAKPVIPAGLDWQSLVSKRGEELEAHYRKILTELGKHPGTTLGTVFAKAQNRITEPALLEKLVVGHSLERMERSLLSTYFGLGCSAAISLLAGILYVAQTRSKLLDYTVAVEAGPIKVLPPMDVAWLVLAFMSLLVTGYLHVVLTDKKRKYMDVLERWKRKSS